MPVSELVNDPVPVPSLVHPGIEGLGDVPTHVPRAVTENPPSLVTLPPDVAVVAAMFDAAVVVTVGTAAPAANS